MAGTIRHTMETFYGDFAPGDKMLSEWGDSVNATLDDKVSKSTSTGQSITSALTVVGTMTIQALAGVLKASSGVVSGGATTSDVPEGSNLYYTTARWDTRLALKTTANLTEGSNLYYTDARVSALLDAYLAIGSGNPQYVSCSLEFDDGLVGKLRQGGLFNYAWEIIGAVSVGVKWSIPLPTTRGGKDLYIKGWATQVSAADASNYITTSTIQGINTTPSPTTIMTSTITPLNSTGNKVYSTTGQDCSSYTHVFLFWAMTGTATALLAFYTPQVEYYYV